MRDSVTMGLGNNDSAMSRERREERIMKAYLIRRRKRVECGGREARSASMKDRVNTRSSVAENLMAASPQVGDPDGNCSHGVEEPKVGLPWVRAGRGGEDRHPHHLPRT